MAFQKVGGQSKYYKYTECEEGQKLVDAGTYLGEKQGKFGVQHVFKQKDGEMVTLNSSGHLNYLLENHVPTGTVCNVYYKEEILLTKGPFKGKKAHNFEVEIDDGPRMSAPKDMPAEKLPTELPEVSL